jgi:hypothetical protein
MEMTSILKHLPTYGVLLCTACPKSYCLPPGSVEKHLRDFHHDVLDRKQRNTLIKYANSLTHDIKHPMEMIVPPREFGPVEGLHLMNGFECLQCGIVYGSEDTMSEQHCRPKHGWTISQPVMWKSQKIQVHF